MRTWLLPGLAVATVLFLGATGIALSREVAVERRRAADGTLVVEVQREVAVEIEESVSLVAARVGSFRPAGQTPGFVPVDSTARTAASPLTEGDRRDPEVVAVLDRSRDNGEITVGRMVELTAGVQPFVVGPVFDRGAAGAPPATTAERRASLVGWVVEPVDLGRLLSEVVPDGAVAVIRQGPVAVTVGERAIPSRLPTGVLERWGHQLEVQAGDPSPVPIGGGTVAAVLATLAAAGAAGYAVADLLRRLRTRRNESETRAAQIRLIGDVGPLVQQSLELAEVLPAIAVQLSDHFELAGVSLTTFGSDGRPVSLFSTGVPPESGVKAVLRPPDRLLTGDTLVLALERGGRSVAQLRLVAGRTLDATELQSLRAITELVTAAVANASLYASQQEALRRLRDLDALKTGFLGTASHELRTPVTAISGFATLLTDSWDRFDDEQRRHFVERIGANARSLGAVVQDLLDFSLLDRGTIVLSLAEIQLSEAARDVVDRLAPIFTAHEIELETLPCPSISADSNGIERVISNLLTNAVKFSPPGTTVTVWVGPSADERYAAELSVSDQGPGIPADERPHVFTRFYRGSGEEVLRTRGVGIGLSVVAEIVGLLGGAVDVSEAPGGGARFTLRFPAAEERAHVTKEATHAPSA